MSRVPPPLPSRSSLNRAQGDLSAAELAALLPPESEEDDERPKPPPLPEKAAVKASTIPPPLPPGTAKGAAAVVPPPLPGNAGAVSIIPPPVWGTEEFDPAEENDSRPEKPKGLTTQQKTLLYLLLGSFLGAVALIALLIFVSQPAKVPEQIEQATQTGVSDTVPQPEQKPLNDIYNLSEEFDDQ